MRDFNLEVFKDNLNTIEQRKEKDLAQQVREINALIEQQGDINVNTSETDKEKAFKNRNLAFIYARAQITDPELKAKVSEEYLKSILQTQYNIEASKPSLMAALGLGAGYFALQAATLPLAGLMGCAILSVAATKFEKSYKDFPLGETVFVGAVVVAALSVHILAATACILAMASIPFAVSAVKTFFTKLVPSKEGDKKLSKLFLHSMKEVAILADSDLPEAGRLKNAVEELREVVKQVSPGINMHEVNAYIKSAKLAPENQSDAARVLLSSEPKREGFRKSIRRLAGAAASRIAAGARSALSRLKYSRQHNSTRTPNH